VAGALLLATDAAGYQDPLLPTPLDISIGQSAVITMVLAEEGMLRWFKAKWFSMLILSESARCWRWNG